LLDGHVQCVLGRIAVDADVWGSVDVMIRPENLVLSNEAGQPAEVVSLDYYGHDQMVTVRLDGGALLRVRMLPREDLAQGQRLSVQLKGEVVIFPHEA
jgi:iron(III) transport system ATP-binding protein